MIHRCSKSSTGYYLGLLLILFLGVFLGIFVSFDKQLQVLVIALTTFFYISWGILHHLLHHDLTSKIVIEYVLIGGVAMSMVVFLLQGGSL